MMGKNKKIAIIGLVYLGLPLARLFATKYSVIGFDSNESRIAKLMSGTDSTLEIDDNTLQIAGTHLEPTIKVVEASKVIENSQGDINIAFVNELAKIFNWMGLNTHDVLETAVTKWFFLPFKPGLVGGHCIRVDPYYLV